MDGCVCVCLVCRFQLNKYESFFSSLHLMKSKNKMNDNIELKLGTFISSNSIQNFLICIYIGVCSECMHKYIKKMDGRYSYTHAHIHT